MKFYGADCDIQLAGDFLIGVIAQNRMQDFLLARAERSRIYYCAALFQQLFRARFQPAGEYFFGRD